MWVTDSRMLCSLPRSCLVHPVDRFDTEGLFSSDQVIFFTVFRVFFLIQKHVAFKWKDAISGFPVAPGSAEAIVRWGVKIKYILIAYFLSNTFATNCLQLNRVCKDYSKSKVGRFLRHSVEALGQCIPLPRHVLRVPPCGESVWAGDFCLLTTFHISQ